MKYRADLPDESVNISSENSLVTVLKLTASLALVAFVAYFALGYIMNFAVSSVTPEQEKRLEELFLEDTNVSDSNSSYLKSITRKLTSCANLPYEIHIRIMEESEPNAFAVPGGVIYITRGMLKKMKSQNELAFIIGHELGHFKHKDHLRSLGYRIIFGAISLMLGSDYGLASSMTLGIGSAKYSQSAELAADSFGLRIMQCAYGSVTDATKIFERMDDGGEWKYFMATHPAFGERIEKMKEQIALERMDTSKKAIPLKEIK